MSLPKELVAAAQRIQADADAAGLGRAGQLAAAHPAPQDYVGLYDQLITSQLLQSATRKLYIDGHYARAVEEAYKCLNNSTKDKSGSSLDGVPLMQQVFSEKQPLLKLNALNISSERNEQTGYMMILAGCMLGIRNPRAHEHKMRDIPEVALELLVWANHLMRMVDRSKRVNKRKKPCPTPISPPNKPLKKL